MCQSQGNIQPYTKGIQKKVIRHINLYPEFATSKVKPVIMRFHEQKLYTRCS